MITNKEKQRRGTLQKSRVKNPMTFELIDNIPDPLEELDVSGQRYFNYVCGLLISDNKLTGADIGAITTAAKVYSVFIEACQNVNKHGYYQLTKSGYSAKNAHFITLMDCNKALRDFEGCYGLNLASRSKLNFPILKKIDEDDAFFS